MLGMSEYNKLLHVHCFTQHTTHLYYFLLISIIYEKPDAFFYPFCEVTVYAAISSLCHCFQSVREYLCASASSLPDSQDCFKFRSDFYARKSFLGKWLMNSLSFARNLRQSSSPLRNNDNLCHFDVSFHTPSFIPSPHSRFSPFTPVIRSNRHTWGHGLRHISFAKVTIHTLPHFIIARNDIYDVNG